MITRDAAEPPHMTPVDGTAPPSVLVVGGSLDAGGLERSSVALANALAEDGLAVWYASAAGPLRMQLDLRVRFIEIANPAHTASRATHELMLYVKHHRFDVVHAHGAMCGLVSSISVKAAKVPSTRVLTIHERPFPGLPRRLAGPVLRRCADHFIAVNHELQAELESLGIRAEKLSLIPDCVDVDDIATRAAALDGEGVRGPLGIPTGAKVLVMAGTAATVRNIEHFTQIAREVAARENSCEIHAVAVRGRSDRGASPRAAAKGVPATMHFVDDRRDLVPYLGIADAVVFASDHADESPTFLLEASAAGRPIVCSNVPGNREIVIDGETGRLVHNDVGAFADAALELLRDPARASDLGAAARDRARAAFDRSQASRRTADLYRRLLSPDGAASAPGRDRRS